MKLVYPSAKGFAKAMEAVWNIIDEGLFKFTKDGINLMAMDPSQISMIVFSMPKESFLEFNLDEERNIGLDIDYLKKVLKRAKQNELLELIFEDGKLNMSFITDKTRREFKIPLLDLIESYNKEPSVEYNNYIKINAEPLKDIVNDANIVSTYVKFIITPNEFSAEAKSENGVVKERFELGDDLSEVKAETGARALYPISYLNDILKATRRGDLITLMIETDKPLRMEFNLEGANIRYYLAPASEE